MNQSSDYLDAARAASLLGVKKATLYAYVSRGLIRAITDPADPRRRLYDAGDVERHHRRSGARAGHAAVAVEALDWGQPVLDTRIADIGVDGPRYRSVPALDFARRNVPFERVALWLWTGDDAASAPWSSGGRVVRGHDRIWAMLQTVAANRLEDEARFATTIPAQVALAQRLVSQLCRVAVAHDVSGSIAERLAAGARISREPATRAIDEALVLVADHGLNVSTFAGRIAASAGADLYGSVSASLATFSGPLHGGACDRVEAFLDEASAASSPASAVRARLARGERVPGFGHPLYPIGDPRAVPMLATAARLGRDAPRVAVALDVVSAMHELAQRPPTVDFGLATLSAALGFGHGMAAALFAVGRSAGWIAHAIEQRGAGRLLRPRARFIGAQKEL